MRSKKPAISLKTFHEEKNKKSIADAKGKSPEKEIEDLKLTVGKFSLRTRIRNNPWLKSGRPANKALEWLHKICFKQPEKYHYKKMLFAQGQLFTFEYFNPKYKNTKSLPWFDKYPLVLSLGPVVTKEGVRNIGFNLHLVPPKIRIIILATVFEIYKKLYRYQIFYKKQGPVQIKYEHLAKPLMKYGAGFCVRMYIPNRIRQIVIFPYNEWHNAIFIPSRSYDGIKATKLIQAWTKYVRNLGFSTRATINWDKNI